MRNERRQSCFSDGAYIGQIFCSRSLGKCKMARAGVYIPLFENVCYPLHSKGVCRGRESCSCNSWCARFLCIVPFRKHTCKSNCVLVSTMQRLLAFSSSLRLKATPLFHFCLYCISTANVLLVATRVHRRQRFFGGDVATHT